MNQPLLPDPSLDPNTDAAPNPAELTTATVTVSDPLGLHLRSGKEVVKVASQFTAHITAQNISRESAKVDVKSILQLMQLQARQGHVLHLFADGPDANEALVALAALF